MPYLAEVFAPSAAIGVAQADYDRQDRTLTFSLCRLGDPSSLRSLSPIGATLALDNIPQNAQIEVNGRPLGESEFARQGARFTFSVEIDPVTEMHVTVRC
jgi:hypothetical protein